MNDEQRESTRLDIFSGGFAFDKAVSKSKDSEPFNGQNRSFACLKAQRYGQAPEKIAATTENEFSSVGGATEAIVERAEEENSKTSSVLMQGARVEALNSKEGLTSGSADVVEVEGGGSGEGGGDALIKVENNNPITLHSSDQLSSRIEDEIEVDEEMSLGARVELDEEEDDLDAVSEKKLTETDIVFNDDLILTHSFRRQREEKKGDKKDAESKKSAPPLKKKKECAVGDVLDTQLQSYLQYNTLEEHEKLLMEHEKMQSPRIRQKFMPSQREEQVASPEPNPFLFSSQEEYGEYGEKKDASYYGKGEQRVEQPEQ